LQLAERVPLDELVSVFTPSPAAPPASSLPPLLEEALAGNTRLFIRYVDQKGHQTERWITPQQVLVLNDYIYVAAHCHLRDEDRQFRLDRLLEMNIADEFHSNNFIPTLDRK